MLRRQANTRVASLRRMDWRVALWVPVGLATARFGHRPGRRATLRAAISIATAATLGRATNSI
ncbi:MAG: hypothetical protein ABJ314_01675, partial [Ilumatobacter sp.]